MLLLLGKGIRLHALFSVLMLKERVGISNYFPELKEQHNPIIYFMVFIFCMLYTFFEKKTLKLLEKISSSLRQAQSLLLLPMALLRRRPEPGEVRASGVHHDHLVVTMRNKLGP